MLTRIDQLKVDYFRGKPIANAEGLQSLTLKVRSGGDGHIVIFEVDASAQTVYVHHVYHTKMDIQSRIDSEFGPDSG